MFKKLVSNLAFSPALVGQLAFYAKRLRKEEVTRKTGLVFMVLSLVVQYFAVFQPPEAANAASGRDLVYGGVSSVDEFLRHYDLNDRGLKSIANYIGITREEIAATSGKQLFTVGTKISWGRLAITSTANGEVEHDASGTTVHSHPMSILYKRGGESREYGYIGQSKKIGWFAITPGCGNFVTTKLPAPQPTPTPTPVPVVPVKPQPTPTPAPVPKCTIPGKTNLSSSDPGCKNDPVATCTKLQINRIGNIYQLNAFSSVSEDVSVESYTYTVKRNGQIIHTKTVNSSSPTASHTYTDTTEGTYSVSVVVKTSIGDYQSPECQKTFIVTAPERCPENTALLKSDPECQPCPGDSTIWLKAESCKGEIVQTKSATNITQGNVSASTVIAKANDKITYRLNVENIGIAPLQTDVIEKLDDVIEYATVIDNGGGYSSTDPETKAQTITWPNVTIAPGEKTTRMFTVQVMNTIPAMGTGISDGTSFDCKITNTFGNQVSIAVDCPLEKQIVETVVAELPHTGPGTNVIVASVALAIVTYFYARSRQLKTEVRLIRRSYNAGTI